MALALIAAIASCIYGWIAIGGLGIIGFSDSADYLFYADFYRGHFASNVSAEAVEFYRTTRFPPLLPFLLAIAGGGTDALDRAQWTACAITLCMFPMVWLWARRETQHAAAAAIITLLVAISPGLFLLTLNPVSEPLAMGLTCLALFLAAKTKPSADTYLLVALVAGISTLARSANIALIVAIPIWLYLQRIHRRQATIATAVAFAPFVAWLLYRKTVPGADYYSSGLTLGGAAERLGGWPDLIYLQPWRLITGVAKNLDNTPGVVSFALVIVLLVCAAIGWLRRLRAGRLDAIFVALYVALILVWPYPREATRFMTFLLPFLFLYAFEGIRRAMSRVPAFRSNDVAASSALFFVFVVVSAATIFRFVELATQPVDPELRGEQREQMYFAGADRATALRTAESSARVRLIARETGRIVPNEDCVYTNLPYVLQIHGGVKAVLFPTKLIPNVDPAAQLARCDYFFVAGLDNRVAMQGPFHLLDELRGWTSTLLVSETRNNDRDVMVAALLKRDEGPASRLPLSSEAPREQ